MHVRWLYSNWIHIVGLGEKLEDKLNGLDVRHVMDQ